MTQELVDRAEFASARPRDVALLRALFAEGRELTKAIAKDRYHIEPRAFRAAVSELRRRGMPIVSYSTPGSTYHLARDEREAEAFVAAEIMSRATDLLEQARAIRAHARDWFDPQQLTLVEGRR